LKSAAHGGEPVTAKENAAMPFWTPSPEGRAAAERSLTAPR